MNVNLVPVCMEELVSTLSDRFSVNAHREEQALTAEMVEDITFIYK